MSADDKVAVELTHTELLHLAGYHFEASAAYRESGHEDAAVEHWERAGELTALVPEDDDVPLDQAAIEAIQEAGAREWAREHNVSWPMDKRLLRAMMRGPRGGEG